MEVWDEENPESSDMDVTLLERIQGNQNNLWEINRTVSDLKREVDSWSSEKPQLEENIRELRRNWGDLIEENRRLRQTIYQRDQTIEKFEKKLQDLTEKTEVRERSLLEFVVPQLNEAERKVEELTLRMENSLINQSKGEELGLSGANGDASVHRDVDRLGRYTADLHNQVTENDKRLAEMRESLESFLEQCKEDDNQREEHERQIRKIKEEMESLKANITGRRLSIASVSDIQDWRKTLKGENNPILHSTQGGYKTRTPVIKAKDIDLLEMHHLMDVDAKERVECFLQQVEQASQTEEGYQTVALARMSDQVRHYVRGLLKEYRGNDPLGEIQRILLENFKRPQQLSDAYRTLMNHRYVIEEEPREFVNRFTTEFSKIRLAFPKEDHPEEEQLWKDIIMEDLPKEIQQKMKWAYPKGISKGLSEMFLAELENQRGYWLRSRVAQVSQARPTEEADRPERRCPWCSDRTRIYYHSRVECPRKPSLRSCYDCLRPNSFRGHNGCPGRPTGQPSVPGPSSSRE